MKGWIPPEELLNNAIKTGSINKPLEILLKKFNPFYVKSNFEKLIEVESFDERLSSRIIKSYFFSLLKDFGIASFLAKGIIELMKTAQGPIGIILAIQTAILGFYLMATHDIDNINSNTKKLQYLRAIKGEFEFESTRSFEEIYHAVRFTGSCLTKEIIKRHILRDNIVYNLLRKGYQPVAYSRIAIFKSIVFGEQEHVAFIDTIEVPLKRYWEFLPLVVVMGYLTAVYTIKSLEVRYIVTSKKFREYLCPIMRCKMIRYRPVEDIRKDLMSTKIEKGKRRRDYLVLSGIPEIIP